MVFWCFFFFFLLTNDDFVQVYQQRGNILSEKHMVGIDEIGRSRFNLLLG